MALVLHLGNGEPVIMNSGSEDFPKRRSFGLISSKRAT